MASTAPWLAAFATVATLMRYEAAVLLMQQRKPERLARSAHASLREEWFAAVSSHPGSEILAVQTLRNSLMLATMTASTAVLGLMGAGHAGGAVPALRRPGRGPHGSAGVA